MLPLILALAVLTEDPAPPPPPPPRPVVITRMDWIRMPTSQQVLDAWPAQARKDGVGGRVFINCTLGEAGRLEACSVSREEPAGLGFGAAALSLSRYYQLRPDLASGKWDVGANIMVPVTFRPAG